MHDKQSRQTAQRPTYSGTDNLEVMTEAHRYNAFLSRLMIAAGGEAARGRVLDFGAGIGLFADRIAPTAGQLTCVELDPAQRHDLARRGYSCVAEIAMVPSNSQDFVYSLNVLEHIEDDTAAAAELFRVLRPGGRLFVYLPAFPCLFTSMDRKVGHLRRYLRDDLSRLLSGAGFEVERLRYADSLGFLATIVYKLQNKTDGAINKKALIIYDRIVFPVSVFLDTLLHPFLGKNVYAFAVKPR